MKAESVQAAIYCRPTEFS